VRFALFNTPPAAVTIDSLIGALRAFNTPPAAVTIFVAAAEAAAVALRGL